MNIIACEYGKYASIDVEHIIDYRTRKGAKGWFPNKDKEFYFDLVPVIGWSIDENFNRTPILINNEKHDNSAIVDLDTGRTWYCYSSYQNMSSLTKIIKTSIESSIEYMIENPEEGQI